MAAYPNTSFSSGSRMSAIENIELDSASDGTIRGRVVSVSPNYDALMVHEALTEAQAASIETFYETDPTRQVEITWRGVQYNARWRGKPMVTHAFAAMWRVESAFLAVRNDGV